MASEKGRLWFHVASVGEFNTAKPLLKRLYPTYHITLTYFSFRAKEYLSSQRGKGYFHQLYRVPPDLPPWVLSFEKRVNPDLILVMERELWPSLLLFTKKPKIWINAYAKGGLFERLLSKRLSLIIAREDTDAEAFRAYGCGEVHACGNLKFVLERPPTVELDIQNELIIVAGSTHEGEEELLRDVFDRVKREFKNLKLIVAPRHLSRVKEVATLFEGFKVSFRKGGDSDWDVLIVDTLGELFSLYAFGKATVVGGTFVPVGGHNLLEPAYFGKPVLYGPYTHKVEDLRRFLEQKGLGFCVKDKEELYQSLRGILTKDESQEVFSLKAYSQKVLDCYLSHLRKWLEV
ncbi:MAG: 3-deoxy-D-manno-octulosonic acid transferase [Aquificaceae bacterium]|nr:3-deoxy-D-manno-octulosonic acid transferase [Aquificaceae bacterium]